MYTEVTFMFGFSSMHQSSLAVALVRKLIAVLESTERLPVITYDHGGGGSGLQVRYSKKISFNLFMSEFQVLYQFYLHLMGFVVSFEVDPSLKSIE